MKRILLSVSCLLFMLAVSVSAAAPAPGSRLLLPGNTMSTRQQIVDEFKRRLAAIDPSASPLANGYQYQTDIGKNGVDDATTNYNEDQLRKAEGNGRLQIRDETRSRGAKEVPDQKGLIATLTIQTRSYHLRDADPVELRKHLDDMAAAVTTDPTTGKQDLKLGGLAIDIEIADDGYGRDTEASSVEFCAVSWNVHHRLTPYAM